VQQLTPNAPPIRVYGYPAPLVNRAAFDVKIVQPVPLPPVFVPTVNVVNVAIPTTAINTTFQVAHGLSQIPQIVLATLSGRTEGANTNGRQHTKKGFGAAVLPRGGVLKQYCVGSDSDDNNSVTLASSSFEPNIACVMAPGKDPNSKTIAGACAIQSIDATNITFVIKTQFDQSYELFLQVFSGDLNITWLKIQDYQAPLATGTQAITGVGFKPDFVLFFGPHLSQGATQVDLEGGSGMFLGACDKNLNQWTLASGVNDNGGGSAPSSAGRARSYMRSGQALGILSRDHSAFNSIGSVQSLDADGFTLNWTISLDSGQLTGREFVALCVQGPVFVVGNYLSQTDTAEHQVVSGITPPEGLLIASANKPASALNVLDSNENWSVAFCKDKTVQLAQYVGQKDTPWAPNTVAYTGIEYDGSYLNLDTAGAVVGKAAVSTIAADGFKITHSVADAAQNFVGYVAYAHPTPPAIRTTVIKTVKPNGGGDYLNLNTGIQTEVLSHKNLYLENIILEFDCYAGTDSMAVKFPSASDATTAGKGFISSPSNYVYVKAVQGHVGLMDYSGSTYLLDLVSTHSSRPFQMNMENIFLEQLQIRLTVSDGTEGAAYSMATFGLVAPTLWIMKNCIAKAVLSNNSTAFGFEPPNIQFDVAGVKAYHINCIAYDFLSRDNQFSGFQTYNCGNQLIVHLNCTAVNCQQGYQDHADVIDLNCAALGCDNGWNTALAATHPGPNPLSDYNFSTTGPPSIGEVGLPGTDLEVAVDPHGPHSGGGQAAYLQDLLNGVPIPLPGDTGLIGKGVNLSANPYFPFNVDVRNTVRTVPWTIGAFHVSAAAPVVQGVWWAWVGGVTDTQATVKIRLNAASGAVRLRVSPNPTLVGYTEYGDVATNANKVATFIVLVGHDTQYYYQVFIGGLAVGPIGTFKSFPLLSQPASFVFACGGCAETGSNTNLYTTLKNQNPLLYLVYGDLHYWNILNNDVTLFRGAFDAAMIAKRRALFLSCSSDYVWDDHDFGADNTSGTSPAKPAAQAAYRENFPAYALPSVDGSIYHSFIVGRCRFVVTDLRSNRDADFNPDGPTHVMMGATQLQWFKDQLMAAKSAKQLVFWFSTVPWIAPVGDNFSDDWGGFATERKNISDFIQANGLASTLIIVCGDMHSAAIDNGTHDVYTTDGLGNHCTVFLPFPENQTTQIYGGVYTQGPLAHVGARLMGFAGLVHVTDDSHVITVTMEVWNELGPQLTFTKAFSLEACFPVVTWQIDPVTAGVSGVASSFTKLSAGAVPAFTPVGLSVPVKTKITPAGTTFTHVTGVDPCL